MAERPYAWAMAPDGGSGVADALARKVGEKAADLGDGFSGVQPLQAPLELVYGETTLRPVTAELGGNPITVGIRGA